MKESHVGGESTGWKEAPFLRSTRLTVAAGNCTHSESLGGQSVMWGPGVSGVSGQNRSEHGPNCSTRGIKQLNGFGSVEDKSVTIQSRVSGGDFDVGGLDTGVG